MTELADRLSRHADLHEHQPWADDEQMQFARDLREAVGLIAELARLRAQKPAAWVRQYHHSGVLCWENEGGNCAPLYRAAPPAQPAEPTIDEQVASVNAVFDAWRNGKDATLTLGLAAQPAEPVQRLSDERAAFEAWHNEYRTQELVRRDDTYYNTHVRCRWEGWQARAIESALQPGWRDVESAPKDGTDVWLHADGKVLRAFWLVKPYRETRDLDGNYIDQQDYDEFWMSCADGDEVEDPTEWQPLVTPLPPKAAK